MPTLLTRQIPNGSHCGAVGAKTVRHDNARPAVALHCALQEFECSLAIPALCGEDLQDLAFVIDGAPEVVCLAVDPHEHLVRWCQSKST